MKISLPYRPPFDFQGLLASYKNHRIGNLESFEDTKMHREIFMNGQCGRVSISDNPSKSSLDVEIDFPDSSVVHAIISRVRALFDLDSDPAIIANSLETDSAIKALLKKHRGIRLPSGWDGFEVAISAILGQLVSVERGRALVHDLIVIAGRDSKYFPTPKEIITADLTSLKTTRQRKLTLVEFSKALIENKISLEPTQDVDNFTKNALAIKGIGPWTANYMSLKILRHADAFPKTDLILARALNHYSLKNIEKMRPWRGYVAALLWKEHARKLKEVNL